jgi:endonuclease/exonuclease/phosphatase family metal-dependent hydrolase
LKRLTRKIILFLNILAVLALCLSYLSNYINPARIWGVAFFGLGYPFLLIINLGFLIYWWWRKNRYALISLFFILIGIGNIGRYFQLNRSMKNNLTDDNLKILTYNVRIFNYFKWENNSSACDSIISFVNRENPDVVCFQEFYTRKDINELTEESIKLKLSSYKYAHIGYTKKFNSKNSLFGIATFSKYPIINKDRLVFSNSVNACIYSDIVVGEDTFRIYNLHLQSINLKKENYALMDSIFYINSKKIDEVKDVTSRLKKAYISRSKQTNIVENHMKESPYPVIMCGDFNDTPVSYTYQKLLGEKSDAYRESGRGFGNTYRGKLPSFRIDYIFYTNHFTSFDYQTFKIKLSDHYPVGTSLVLKGK